MKKKYFCIIDKDASKTYGILKDFYSSIINKKYDYLVHIAQKSYDLHRFFSEEKIEYNKKIVVETGLLGLAHEIASSYIKGKIIKEILILDLFFDDEDSRKLNALLVRFEDALIREVKK